MIISILHHWLLVMTLKGLTVACDFLNLLLDESLCNRLLCGLKTQAVQRYLSPERDLIQKKTAQMMEMVHHEARP